LDWTHFGYVSRKLEEGSIKQSNVFAQEITTLDVSLEFGTVSTAVEVWNKIKKGMN
jgi:hypothetical protein